MKPLLLVLDDREHLISTASFWKSLEEMVEIKFLDGSINDVNDSYLKKVEFLMAIRERTALTKEVLMKLPKLKLILQTGGHAYHIDTVAAKEQGILIALGRRAKAPLFSVPELTFAMALGLIHLVPQANKALHNGQWPSMTGRILSNRRMGILGMGRHGTRVANIAKNAFNMDVVAWDRTGNGNYSDDGFPRLQLDELLETSDLVSIHLKLSEQSTQLMNKERLQKMKPGAILINTSRGTILDEKYLAEALVSGQLGGAGLDVFEIEPLPVNSPLRSLENVILTPHIGWTVKEVFAEFAEIACTQLSEYLQGTLAATELLDIV